MRLTLLTLRETYTRIKRLAEQVFIDRPAGIETATVVSLQELGVAAPERVDYEAAPWGALRRILKRDEIDERDVFIDLGCGKGRALLQAAKYPFKRVIGVELSAELANVAMANIERFAPKLRCKNVEVVHSDVLKYDLPDDVTVVFMNNPFQGRIFGGVVEKLQESLRRRPRALRIVYYLPDEEEQLLRAGAVVVRTARALRPTRRWALKSGARLYRFG